MILLCSLAIEGGVKALSETEEFGCYQYDELVMIRYQILLAILAIFLASNHWPKCSCITFWNSDENSNEDKSEVYSWGSFDGRRHRTKPDYISFDNQKRVTGCGQQIRTVSSRIVGGKMAPIVDFP